MTKQTYAALGFVFCLQDTVFVVVQFGVFGDDESAFLFDDEISVITLDEVLEHSHDDKTHKIPLGAGLDCVKAREFLTLMQQAFIDSVARGSSQTAEDSLSGYATPRTVDKVQCYTVVDREWPGISFRNAYA